MTVNEFFTYCTNCKLIVKSGYNGRVLTQNYNPAKHSEILGKREVIGIKPEIALNKSGGCDTAYAIICCWVSGME